MKTLVIFTNTDWHFYAHLLPIALEARAQGYKVKIVTNVTKSAKEITAHGLEVIPLTIKRSSLNPFREILLLVKIIKILLKEKPHIIHNFTIKPIIYGSIAGFLCRTPKVINNFLGMGLLFKDESWFVKIARHVLIKNIFWITKYKEVLFIVQNNDDAEVLRKQRISKNNDVIIQCSVGIPSQEFSSLPEPEGNIIFALVARMIVDKGIGEFIEAAQILKRKNILAEFWLVGEPDADNRHSIPLEKLIYHHNQGDIKYIGYQENIKNIWKQAHVAVLPSYHEGISRSLLEAGAFGRAIIATNAPGNRELVTHGQTGLLVGVKDIVSLADAMELLTINSSLRKTLGLNARNHILENYDAKILATKTVRFY